MGFQNQWVLIHISLQLMGMFSLNLVEIQLKPLLGATVCPAQELSCVWRVEAIVIF